MLKRVYARLKSGYIRYKTKDFAPDNEFLMEEIKNIANYYPFEKTEKGYIFEDADFDYERLICCYVIEPYSKEKHGTYENYEA